MLPRYISVFALALLTSHHQGSALLPSATRDPPTTCLLLPRDQQHQRRAFLSGLGQHVTAAMAAAAAAGWAFLLLPPPTAQADTGAEVRGIPVNAFNGLIYNYRGNTYGGLSAADLKDEPSISYRDFVNRLQKGEVEFVEFLAPNGDAAYVIFKGDTVKPIRIGEGYPIEQPDGWSSPAFAVRTVKNAGVPYKFTLPALAKFQQTN